jgi:menaquinone-dependent protoporphyrinogen oxidase
MSVRVLVAFATKSGSTAGIAQAIAEELRLMGLDAEARPVGEVRDVRPYGAVVLGSAIYFGRWRKEALRFGLRHAGELRGRPLWLFDSGPTNTSADEGKNEPIEAADRLARAIGARARVTFGGRFMPEDAGRFTRRLIESGKSGTFVFGDFRNFDRIRTWARGIGAQLRAVQPVEAR